MAIRSSLPASVSMITVRGSRGRRGRRLGTSDKRTKKSQEYRRKQQKKKQRRRTELAGVAVVRIHISRLI